MLYIHKVNLDLSSPVQVWPVAQLDRSSAFNLFAKHLKKASAELSLFRWIWRAASSRTTRNEVRWRPFCPGRIPKRAEDRLRPVLIRIRRPLFQTPSTALCWAKRRPTMELAVSAGLHPSGADRARISWRSIGTRILRCLPKAETTLRSAKDRSPSATTRWEAKGRRAANGWWIRLKRRSSGCPLRANGAVWNKHSKPWNKQSQLKRIRPTLFRWPESKTR